MKKALIAVFSVSLTAGTLYLAYSSFKDFLIKKLMKVWIEESKKQKKELNDEQLKQVKVELDKLSLWEVKLLGNYTQKVIRGAPEKDIAPIISKLKEKKILERANLKVVETILFGNNTITNH